MKRKRNWFEKIAAMVLSLLMIFSLMPVSEVNAAVSSDNGDGTFSNPVIYSDVPDLDAIRVGDAYYMISTTMHLSPGCPVMKSTDLVNWEIVNYVYDTLGDSDELALRNGQESYGNGSWAASIRYFKEKFYVTFGCMTTGKTYVYSTSDIENGPWHKSEFTGYLHDISLLTTEDEMYVVYGSGTARCRKLTEDENGDITFGEEFTLVEYTALDNDGNQVNAPVSYISEGIHAYKIGEYYYLFMIQWPTGGRRQEVCWRSKTLDGNGWESKKIFDSGLEFDGIMDGAGVAQGGVFQTPEGDWYSLLFQDHGSVGRIPVLVPVTWEDNWPVFGNENGEAEVTMDIPGVSTGEKGIVVSDEFYNGETRKIYSDTESTEPAEEAAVVNETPALLSAAETLGGEVSYVELLENGGFEEGDTGWESKEGAVLEVTQDEAAGGESSLLVTERVGTGSGPKQDLTGKLEAGKTYHLSAKVKYLEGPDTRDFNITFHYGTDQWSGMEIGKGATITKGEWGTIEGTYTVPEDADLTESYVFVETTWKAEQDPVNDLMDFYVDDISVSCEEDYGLILNGGFESGMDPWEVRNYNGAVNLEVTQEDAAAGTSSLFVSGKEDTTCGPMQDLTGKLEAGKTYYLSAKVKYLDGPDKRDFNITFQYGTDKWSGTDVGKGASITKGEWGTIEGTYTVPEDADLSKVTVFVETTWTSEQDPVNDLMDYYLDEVSVKEVADQEVPEETEQGENDYNGSNLNLAWQWNHNPNNNNWSLTARSGYLRLTTGNTVDNIQEARNTLTQRTYGPTCSGNVALEVHDMKNGDVAGLAAFQLHYGFVGVKMENNQKYLVMVKTETDDNPDGDEIERVELNQDRVYLRVDFDYRQRTDKAVFYYSLDGEEWIQIGDTLQMAYTIPHFMGYRFGLFNYATETKGGYVDFDYFHVEDDGSHNTGSGTEPLSVSLENLNDVPGIANTEIELPITMDALPEGSYEKLEMSVNIPEEFQVSEVKFKKENVSGTAAYSYTNGQLILSVSGEDTDFKHNDGDLFATAVLKVSKYLTEDVQTSARVDYVKVTGDEAHYQVGQAVSNISMKALDTEAVAKKVGYSNPVIDYDFGADPFAMVYDGRVYLYMTADEFEYNDQGEVIDNTYGTIQEIRVVSSADMVNWTDHGTIHVAGEEGIAKWASLSWAPAAAYKKINGEDKFFLYFCNGGSGIGVLEGDSPIGPFRDPNGKVLVDGSVPGAQGVVWMFDPAVMVDDDGSGYLVFGGGIPAGQDLNPKTARIIKLGDDMTSVEGEAQMIDAPCMFEDGGLHKANGKYYYTYCSNFSGDHSSVEGYPGYGNICYMVSDDPMGPYEYKGEILLNPSTYFGVGGNNHHAIFTFNGKSYITYHAQTLGQAMGIEKGYRSTHINEVSYYSNGDIKQIPADRTGVSQLTELNPYERVEGETVAWQSGIDMKDCSEPGDGYTEPKNRALTSLQDGDWAAAAGMDFRTGGAISFTAGIASYDGGSIALHLDSPDGPVAGTLEVPKGDGTYQEYTCNLDTPITDTHSIFFTFSGTGESESLMDIDYWQFTEGTAEVNKDGLKDAIERATAVDVDKYTEDSVAKMQEKLEEALTVFGDDTATQKQVNDAEEELEKAIEDLELKPQETEYEILKGADSTWQKETETGLVYELSPNLDKFQNITVDEIDVDPSNYTADKEAMTIEVSPEYLNSLEIGLHLINFVFEDGQVSAKLTIEEAPVDEEAIFQETMTEVTASVDEDNQVVIQWQPVENAKSYGIYRRAADGSSFEGIAVASQKELTYMDKEVVEGETYYYTVKAFWEEEAQGITSRYPVNVHVTIPNTTKEQQAAFKQVVPKVTVKAEDGAVVVDWEEVEHAASYRIYRKETGGSFSGLANVKAGVTTYTDTTAQEGKTYYYTVKGFWEEDAKGVATRYPSDVKIQVPVSSLATPSVKTRSVNYCTVEVTWNKIAGADKYVIYRKEAKPGTAFRSIGTVNGGTLQYRDGNAEMGVNYYYTVKAYAGSIYSDYQKTVTGIAVPSSPSLSASGSSKGVTITWTGSRAGANKFADGYRVFRKAVGGSWKTVGTVGANTRSFTDTTGAKGTTYVYTVRAYVKQSNGTNLWGTYNTTGVTGVKK